MAVLPLALTCPMASSRVASSPGAISRLHLPRSDRPLAAEPPSGGGEPQPRASGVRWEPSAPESQRLSVMEAGVCTRPTAPAWTEVLASQDACGKLFSWQRGAKRTGAPVSRQGKPETWKAWCPCPMGFSEGNRDSPVGGQAELLQSCSHFCMLGVAGWLTDTPPGALGPQPYEGQRQTIRPTENRWPLFLWEPGECQALVWGGRDPCSTFQDGVAAQEGSVAPLIPTCPPDAQPRTPQMQLPPSRPSATPFPSGPGRPWPLISLPKEAGCEEG